MGPGQMPVRWYTPPCASIINFMLKYVFTAHCRGTYGHSMTFQRHAMSLRVRALSAKWQCLLSTKGLSFDIQSVKLSGTSTSGELSSHSSVLRRWCRSPEEYDFNPTVGLLLTLIFSAPIFKFPSLRYSAFCSYILLEISITRALGDKREKAYRAESRVVR